MRQNETCEAFAKLAQRQAALAAQAPLSFFTGAMLAGGFIGTSLILSQTVGVHLDEATRPLVMGSVFGLGIILTIFGGGELFTGQVMFASFALLRGQLSPGRALQFLTLAWVGNLCGVVLVCGLFAIGGGGHIYGATAVLAAAVSAKIHSSVVALLARAILCNWLACMGIWTASRLKSDGGKFVVLAWCVMTYVTCGLEHSVANMAVFALGLMAPIPVGDIAGAASSLAVVSLGNLIGGGVFVAGAYMVYARGEQPASLPAVTVPDLPHMPPAIQGSLAEVASKGLSRAA